MAINQYRFSTLFLLFVGLVVLVFGMGLYLGNNGDSFWEKIGLILFTCGALFVGMGYTVFVTWVAKQD
jgi:hypothetical protein